MLSYQDNEITIATEFQWDTPELYKEFCNSLASKVVIPKTNETANYDSTQSADAKKFQNFRLSTSLGLEGPTVETINPSQITFLAELFKFRESDKIINFLQTYPFLTDILEEIYVVIKTYFAGEQPSLEVRDDSTNMDNNYLLISIPTKLKAKEIKALFKEMRKDWFHKNNNRIQGKISFNFEFK